MTELDSGENDNFNVNNVELTMIHGIGFTGAEVDRDVQSRAFVTKFDLGGRILPKSTLLGGGIGVTKAPIVSEKNKNIQAILKTILARRRLIP